MAKNELFLDLLFIMNMLNAFEVPFCIILNTLHLSMQRKEFSFSLSTFLEPVMGIR